MTTDYLPHTITADMVNACVDTTSAIAAFSVANPSVAPKNGCPDLVKVDDRTHRAAFGTKNAIWYCDKCGVVGNRVHHDGNEVVTDCCNGLPVVDMAARAWAKFA